MLIGIDMGGTNIDGVVIYDGAIIRQIKKPVDASDYYKTINNCLRDLIKDINPAEISRINLSTTISTNAIVESNTTPVTLISQEGPGIRHNYDLADEVYLVSGYVDHRGIMVKDLDPVELDNIPVHEGHNLAIVTKFSTRNPQHENTIYDYFKDKYPQITRGHKLSGRLNFMRRVNTAILNSAVYDRYQLFGENIQKTLEALEIDAPVYILKADGGTMTLEEASRRPVETILSGPAASFMGMVALCDLGENSLLLDIGGTTTDIFFVIDGSPIFEAEGIEINGHKTLVRSIYSQSIGIGGDSLVKVDGDGIISVGPTRAGTPLIYGGNSPTLTDALAILGQVGDVDVSLAEEVFESLGEIVELNAKGFAEAVVTVATTKIWSKVQSILSELNSRPVQTIKEVLEDKKISIDEIKVVGGPAKALAPYLKEEFGLDVEVADNYAVANAIGAAVSRPTQEINLLGDTSRGILSVPEKGVYQEISSEFGLSDAVDIVYELMEVDPDLVEITQQSEFNMVDGSNFGKNIRIHAQVKPGLIEGIGGNYYES